MQTIELFCGTKSFSKVAAKRGHATFTVDLEEKFSPDLCADILKLKMEELPAADFIWASPPCTGFSVASIGAHWGGGRGAYEPKSETAKLGIKLVKKTIQLIEEVGPKWWVIENPRGVLRKMPFMAKFRRVTVWYCRYGSKRAKPTDLWVNIPESVWSPRPPCKNGGDDHEAAPRGSRTGTQGLAGAMERGVVPPALIKEILAAVERA